MSELAAWEAPAPAAVSVRDVVDGWAVTFAGVAKLSEYIASTEFVPKAYRDQPAAVTAAILAGRELGLGPMASLQHLYVIEGRPAVSAQMMRGLAMGAGHTFRVVESTASRCTVTGRRRGETVDREPVTWTGEEVRRAGLANRQPWQRYPRAMLLARATAEFCRANFPDVLGGMSYAVEEAADMPADGVDVPEAPAPVPSKTVRRRNTPSVPAPADDPRPDLPVRAEDAASPPARGTASPESGEAPPTPAELPPLPDDAGPPPENGPASPAGGRVPAEDAPPGPDTPPGPERPREGVTVDPAPETMADDDATDEATGLQRGKVFALLTDLGAMTPRARRLAIVSALIGRELESMNQLTRAEATPLIDVLVRIKEGPDPEGDLAGLVAQGTARLVLGGRVIEEPALPLGDDAP